MSEYSRTDSGHTVAVAHTVHRGKLAKLVHELAAGRIDTGPGLVARSLVFHGVVNRSNHPW